MKDKEKPTPKERVDLGPLELSTKDQFSMTAEEKSRASRGESSVTFEGKSIPIEAPVLGKKGDGLPGIGPNGPDDQYEIDAKTWDKFLKSGEVEKYIKEAHDKSDTLLSLAASLKIESAKKRLVKEAYKLWYDWSFH